MPDRILTEISDYTVTVSIHKDDGISTLDMEPSDVYRLAQHLEWLTEPPVELDTRRVKPSLALPDGTAAWAEFTGAIPAVIHIALIGDDDDLTFGRAIALSPATAAGLANTLIAKAVLIAEPIELDDEEESEDV